jgi:hypothetical protein
MYVYHGGLCVAENKEPTSSKKGNTPHDWHKGWHCPHQGQWLRHILRTQEHTVSVRIRHYLLLSVEQILFFETFCQVKSYAWSGMFWKKEIELKRRKPLQIGWLIYDTRS